MKEKKYIRSLKNYIFSDITACKLERCFGLKNVNIFTNTPIYYEQTDGIFKPFMEELHY